MVSNHSYRKFINVFDFYHTVKTLDHLNKIRTFVQVGAHDGIMHDPLRKFILKNKWQGLMIEPQIEMLEKCKYNYKNIDNLFFLNAAVHPSKNRLKLFKAKNPIDYSHTGWASINNNRFDKTIYADNIIEEIVPAMDLMDAIESFQMASVDILQIDTEGFDLFVIKMFNFKKFSPLIIQYETRHLSKEDKEVANLILSNNKYFSFHLKNDSFAIRRDLIKPYILFSYMRIRIYSSIKSRFYNKVNNN